MKLRRGRPKRADRARRLEAARRMRQAWEAGGVLAEMVAASGVGANTIGAIAKADGWSLEARASALAAKRTAQIEAVSPIARVTVVDGHVTCRTCGESRPVACFRRTNRGGECLRSVCRRCIKRRHRRPRAALREAARQAKQEARDRRRHLIALRTLLRVFFAQRCADEGRSVDTVEYRARWDRDPLFRERERTRQKAYKHANPHVAAGWGDKRKRQVAQASDGTLTGKVVRRLFAEATLCPYCAVDMLNDEKTLDHMEPVSRGGAHSLTNVLVCCRACNIEKSDTPYDAWLVRVRQRAGVAA